MKRHLILFCALAIASAGTDAAPVSEQIIVDQFGWRAAASNKTAVFAHPITGQNSGTHYVPGGTFQIRRASDTSAVFTGSVVQWKSGTTNSQSGDQAWWGDFSSFSTPGEYQIYDPANNLQSFNFEIRDDIFNNVLKTTGRAFYYQRCGTAISAECGGNWNHAACHTQDMTATLWITSDQGNPRNVSGGWHDAGDFNKYVPFTLNTLWHLMMGYELFPQAYGDDWNIPESGNRVPDILDEVKYELDWILRMQGADGGVFNRNRVAVLSYTGNYPQDDTLKRYYTQATTWATASAAASWAHAARVFQGFDAQYPGYSTTLVAAAESAWTYLESKLNMYPASGYDGASMAAADASSNTNDDRRRRVLAAAELYAATGKAKYRTYFDNTVTNIDATKDGTAHPLNGSMLPDAAWALNAALIVYAKTTNSTDSSIVNLAKTSLKNGADWYPTGSYQNQDDPYRAYMWDGHYCWGSSQMKALWAILPIMAIHLNVNPASSNLYRIVSEEYLHYLHGRNPLSYCYLSNMGAKGANLGAEKSMMEPYHGWFKDGSPLYDGASSTYGPAPGFLAGGPNQYFPKSFVAPPYGEPPQKAFKDWNTGWNASQGDNENSWEITEPGIYYQAAYTLVLGFFCYQTSDADFDGMPDWWEQTYLGGTGRDGTGHWDSDGISDGDEYICGTDPGDSLSVFGIDGQMFDGSGRQIVSWNSATGRLYSVWSRTNLLSGQWTKVVDATNLHGSGTTMIYTNTSPLPGPVFNKITVRLN